MFFFVNDPATTEIYTYLHTPALHDALPISLPYCSMPSPQDHPMTTEDRIRQDLDYVTSTVRRERVGRGVPAVYFLCASIVPPGFALIDFFPQSARSEEHTSELQSLMRISYAVFCLKKKTNTQT